MTWRDAALLCGRGWAGGSWCPKVFGREVTTWTSWWSTPPRLSHTCCGGGEILQLVWALVESGEWEQVRVHSEMYDFIPLEFAFNKGVGWNIWFDFPRVYENERWREKASMGIQVRWIKLQGYRKYLVNRNSFNFRMTLWTFIIF